MTTVTNVCEQIKDLRSMLKQAFLPMPQDMPQQQQMDPAMMQQMQMQQGGMPPQGMPPQQGGQPPMDPAMMQQGGQPPMDPAQGGQMPQQDPMQIIEQLTQGLEEIFGVVQEMSQALEQMGQKMQEHEQKMEIIVSALDQPGSMPGGMQGGPEAMGMGGMQPEMVQGMEQMAPPGMM